MVGGVVFAVSVKSQKDQADALAAYRTKAHHESEIVARSVAGSYDQIYQNLRTISLLASVRRIDRHGKNLSADGRQSIQQIYNNLASNVDVSEVYVVPEDMDPDATDPETGEKQAPILMFDKVRLGLDAGEPEDAADPNAPPQEEIYEYRALRQQAVRLRSEVPKLGATGASIPFFTIPSGITCDNSVFNLTRKDADRTGPIVSVPFYGENNLLKGTISAIMLDRAVQKMLPERDYALVDTSNGDVFGSIAGGQQAASLEAVRQGKADDDLFYSEVMTVDTKGANKPFKLWSGRSRDEFLNSEMLTQVQRSALIGYAFAGVVGVLALALYFIVNRSLNKAKGEAQLRKSLVERTAEIDALAAERERVREASEESQRRADAERSAGAAAVAREQAQVVEAIGTGLDRLSRGDLVFRLQDPFASSYEQLRADYNAAMAELQDTIRVVSGNTEGIRSGTDEISRAADDLSRRTEQQAGSLEETAAALDEITATVTKTAEAAAHARRVVDAAQTDAGRSGEVVRSAVEAMSEIEKSSVQISQIIGVIDEIAFQTNLLALNAGVEAARAGDAGRGFAVVASEVRALAQRSAEAAKEIKALISASSAQVRTGVDLVGETGKALSRIAVQVAEINGTVSEIAASTREQSTALAEVNTAVNQMDQVTQQNAAMVEQTTAASHSLTQEAEALALLIARFTVDGQTHIPPRIGPAHLDMAAAQAASRRDAPGSRQSPIPKRATRTAGNLALKQAQT